MYSTLNGVSLSINEILSHFLKSSQVYESSSRDIYGNCIYSMFSMTWLGNEKFIYAWFNVLDHTINLLVGNTACCWFHTASKYWMRKLKNANRVWEGDRKKLLYSSDFFHWQSLHFTRFRNKTGSFDWVHFLRWRNWR